MSKSKHRPEPEKTTAKVRGNPDKQGKARKAAAGKGKAVAEKAKPHWRPLKKDREAFAEGRLTPAAKKMNRMVSIAFSADSRRAKAQERYDATMDQLYAKVAGSSDKGVTIVSADMKRRVVFSKKNIVSGNQNAYMAKQLIDEYVREMLGRNTLGEDDRQMAEFLTNVVSESKGKIMLTRNLISFRRMQFTDERLIKAQKLLTDAFEVTETKLYSYCEERGSDGEYHRA
jgi:hypothetical protein